MAQEERLAALQSQCVDTPTSSPSCFLIACQLCAHVIVLDLVRASNIADYVNQHCVLCAAAGMTMSSSVSPTSTPPNFARRMCARTLARRSVCKTCRKNTGQRVPRGQPSWRKRRAASHGPSTTEVFCYSVLRASVGHCCSPTETARVSPRQSQRGAPSRCAH